MGVMAMTRDGIHPMPSVKQSGKIILNHRRNPRSRQAAISNNIEAHHDLKALQSLVAQANPALRHVHAG
jgi:hypothetical protein